MSFLPDGNLPKFIYLSSVFSIFNSVQCMVAPLGLTKRIYNGKNQQVTELSSHTFAAWTILSAVIRYKCAFNMDNALLYDITLCTYLIALGHFASEIFVFRTARLVGPVLSTLFVAGSLQKRLMKFILQRTIGRFIKDELDWDKDLDVQISSGVFQLRNVRLNEEVIGEILGASPLVFKNGNIGNIKVDIAWSRLLSGGCKIEIENPIIELDLIDAEKSYKQAQDISESLFTDGGQSILASSVYIADDFLKTEVAGEFKYPHEFNDHADTRFSKGNVENQTQPTQKLDIISDIVDKIIFGTDISIKNIKLIIRYGNNISEIDTDNSEYNQKYLILQVEKISLQESSGAESVKFEKLSPKIEDNVGFDSPQTNTTPESFQTKYKYVRVGKMEKKIGISKIRIQLKNKNSCSTLLSIIEHQPKAEISIWRRLPFTQVAPVGQQAQYLGYPPNSNEIDFDNAFSGPMPGEFRDIQPSRIKSDEITLDDLLGSSKRIERKGSVDSDILQIEGWGVEIDMGTLAVVIRPDQIPEIIEIADIMGNWMKMREKTKALVDAYYSAHYDPSATKHSIPLIDSENQYKRLVSINLDRLFLCLISPDSKGGSTLEQLRIWPNGLKDWDYPQQFSHLIDVLEPLKHIKLSCEQLNINFDCSENPKNENIYSTFIKTEPLSETDFSGNISVSVEKISLVEHDIKQTPKDYDVIKWDWSLKRFESDNQTHSMKDFWGWISQNGTKCSFEMAPVEVNLSIDVIKRFKNYTYINAKENELTRKNKTPESPFKPSSKAPKTHASKFKLGMEPKKRDNSDSGLRTKHENNLKQGIGIYSENDDFVGKNYAKTAINLADYMDNQIPDKLPKTKERVHKVQENKQKSIISLFAPLIRLWFTLPSDMNNDDKETYQKFQETLDEYNFLNLDGFQSELKESPSQKKQVVVDWFDVFIKKSTRTDESFVPKSPGIAKKASSSSGLRLEGGYLKVYLQTSNHNLKSKKLCIATMGAENLEFGTEFIPEINNETNQSENPPPYLEITLQPQNKYLANSKKTYFSSNISHGKNYIPRPPALEGLQGTIGHDTKSRRSLETEMIVTSQYQQRCLDRAEVTVDFYVPYTNVELDTNIYMELMEYMEMLSLWMAKEQQKQSKKQNLYDKEHMNDTRNENYNNTQESDSIKTLSVLLANFSRIHISINSKLQHVLSLTNTQAFVVVGIVENDKTYCHLHSHHLSMHTVNIDGTRVYLFNNTASKKSLKQGNLPQLSVDYLSTPKLQDTNEMVVRVDWSTVELDRILKSYKDILEFFEKRKQESSNTKKRHDDVNIENEIILDNLFEHDVDIIDDDNNNVEMQFDFDIPKRRVDVIDEIVVSAESSNYLEVSPLQLYLFIRNFSVQYKLVDEKGNSQGNEYLPQSIIIGVDTISFLNLFNPNEFQQIPGQIQVHKISVGGISVLGLPGFSSNSYRTRHGSNKMEITSAINPEKLWISKGYNLLLSMIMVDISLREKLVVVEVEAGRFEFNADTLTMINATSNYFEENFTLNNLPQPIAELITEFQEGFNVMDDIDESTFKPKNKVHASEQNKRYHYERSDFLKSAFEKDDTFIDKKSYSNYSATPVSASINEEEALYSTTMTSEKYLSENGFDTITPEEANQVMNEYRKTATNYRQSAINTNGFNYSMTEPGSPLNFGRISKSGSRSSEKMKKQSVISFSDEETERIEIDTNHMDNIDKIDQRFGVINHRKYKSSDYPPYHHEDLKSTKLKSPSDINLIEDYFDLSSEDSIGEMKLEKNVGIESSSKQVSKANNLGDTVLKINFVFGKMKVYLYKSFVWGSKTLKISNQKAQMEIEAINLRLQYKKHMKGAHLSWDLALNLGQLNIYDLLESSQWSKFLTRLHVSEYKHFGIHPMLFHSSFKKVTSIQHPVWISSNKYQDPLHPDILQLKIESVRPNYDSGTKNKQKVVKDGTELNELRLDVGIAPIRCYIDQDALTFLIDLFTKSSESPTTDFGNQQKPKNGKEKRLNRGAERMGKIYAENQPYFQAVSISPILVKFDYKPKQTPLSNIGNKTSPNVPSSSNLSPKQQQNNQSGQPLLVEILNLIALEEASISLETLQLYGVGGINKLITKAANKWLPHITQTQIPQVVGSLTPLKPLANVGSSVIDLVLLPISEYKKNGKWYKGLQKGIKTFAQTSALESLNFGAKIAVNTQTILEQAGDILNIPQHPSNYEPSIRSTSVGSDNERFSSKYAVQPSSASEGVRQAYRGLSRNLHQVAQTILAIPVQYDGNDFDVGFEYVNENSFNDYTSIEEEDDIKDELQTDENDDFVNLDIREHGKPRGNSSMKNIVRAD
ncbi:hypothetical protein BB559_000798 [Furculomyces boomerangus]|uniref:Autophagy-related protein 2 n=1 Tax=Furculomyces boomerangus TaxID=61424 RepID=A0A2T9Z477_9FUNG|nr:hypothetical protein BB559_000798 [Furculomyces boomerangus]